MISVGSSRWIISRMSFRCSSSRTSCFCATRNVASWAPVRPPPAMSTNTLGPLPLEPPPQLHHALKARADVDHVAELQHEVGGGESGAAGPRVGHRHALCAREEVGQPLALPLLAHLQLVDLHLAVARGV